MSFMKSKRRTKGLTVKVGKTGGDFYARVEGSHGKICAFERYDGGLGYLRAQDAVTALRPKILRAFAAKVDGVLFERVIPERLYFAEVSLR